MMDLDELNLRAQLRVCQTCGMEFEADEQGSALAKYVDHEVMHQPTSAQWTEDYRRIKAGKVVATQ